MLIVRSSSPSARLSAAWAKAFVLRGPVITPKMVHIVRNMEVADECAHEASLTDTGRECKAERHEIAVEALYARELGLDNPQGLYRIGVRGDQSWSIPRANQ